MTEMVICGRGGQGVVFLTRQIGRILTEKGMDVISSETHGMAVRGGSINSHLRIGAFKSPLIRPGHADFLLSLDASETSNNLHFLKPGAPVIENSNLPNEPGVLRIDAAEIAKQIGRAQLENTVLLGFAAAVKGFPVDIRDIEEQLAGDPRPEICEMNLAALRAGADSA
jgi:indolepyruvate ferredoxin oxidoreductase, beta subunit